MFKVLPNAEDGTKHLTDVAESNVMLDGTELKSAKMMRHTLEVLSKFGNGTETVTKTASSLENGGLRMTVGDGVIGRGVAGGAVDAGDAPDVAGGAAGGAVDAGDADDVAGGAAGRAVDAGDAADVAGGVG
jgi:hypothetical protein